MMFNFDAESNASSILRSMYREMVPLQNITVDSNSKGFWENEYVLMKLNYPLKIDLLFLSIFFSRRMAERIQRLPSHVNIVNMYRSLTDYIPELPDCRIIFPDALPIRLNPDGYGRNMSLFLIMKKLVEFIKIFH